MDGWFPRINIDQVIASGSSGIWLTEQGAARQVSPFGIGPIWAGRTLVFNLKDGKTTDVGGTIINAAYNDYSGSDGTRWAGFSAPSGGRVDLYDGRTLIQQIPSACAPRLGGSRFAYLTPYQKDVRALIIDGVQVAAGVIMDVKLSRGGEFFVYMVATGTYTRQMLDASGRVISIRNDEAPLVAFVGPNGEPWVMSGTALGTFVRPIYSSVGYVISGDMYYPDARIDSSGQLLVAGSFSNGAPRYERINFSAPRQDLKDAKPPAPPLVLPAPTRPMWFGWYEFASSPLGPGNTLIAVRNMSGNLGRDIIVSSESKGLVSGLSVLGESFGNEDGSSLARLEALAKASVLRPVVYWDARRWPRWPALPDGGWCCVQAYCGAQESPEAFEADIRSILQSAPAGLPLVLVGQQYSSNKNNIGYVDPTLPAPQDSEGLKKIAPALVRLANAHANVVALLLFSGYGRRGGLMDHPDLVGPWTAWAAQLQRPALEPYPPKQPPDPPKPPDPKPSLFIKHKEHRMSAAATVAIAGIAGLYGRPDKPNTGPWAHLKDDAGQPRNWRGMIWDGVKDGSGNIVSKDAAALGQNAPKNDDYKFDLTMPDGRHSLYHAGVDGFFGADATGFATSPGADQFYIKPAAETRGGYESPVIYEGNLTSKLLSGQVEYSASDGRPAYVSCAFSVEVLS